MLSKTEFTHQLRERTKSLALRVIKLYQSLPKTGEAKIIGNQLLRSATSVGANYRSACRGRSEAEFFAKLSITIEEADECLYWLELLVDAQILPSHKCELLKQEFQEVVLILSKARKTLSNNKK
jgi:four helix bundle protein